MFGVTKLILHKCEQSGVPEPLRGQGVIAGEVIMRCETMRKDDGMHRNNIAQVLHDLRLALGGAIAGAAVIGIFAHSLGLRGDDLIADLIGASLGFAAVVAVRFAHLI